MEQTIKQMYIRAQEINKQYKKLVDQYNTCSPGKRYSLKLQMNALQGRMVALDKALQDKVNGEIIYVTYLYNNHEVHGSFVNLSNDDIRCLFKLIAQINKADIQIKEIIRKKTLISDVDL